MEKTTLVTHLKYGKEDEPWKPNLLTAVLQLVLAPVAFLLGILIAILIVVYDFLGMGSQHIVFRATPKKIEMPDGTILSK